MAFGKKGGTLEPLFGAHFVWGPFGPCLGPICIYLGPIGDLFGACLVSAWAEGWFIDFHGFIVYNFRLSEQLQDISR